MKVLYTTVRGFIAHVYSHSPFFCRKRYYRSLVSLLREELLKSENGFHILEIGAMTGNSSVMWAKVCEKYGKGDVTCIDWWTDANIESAFRRTVIRSGVDHRIKPARGNSNDVLPTLPKHFYDFIFIDGGHSYSQTKNDILNATRLLKDGGVLCGDDLELQANEVDQAFLTAHREDEKGTDPKMDVVYHPGVTTAVYEFFGVLPKDRVFWAVRKKNDMFEPISISVN